MRVELRNPEPEEHMHSTNNPRSDDVRRADGSGSASEREKSTKEFGRTAA